MLTREENELLTRIGRGTPCGELLRRYWHPVAAVGGLPNKRPSDQLRFWTKNWLFSATSRKIRIGR